MGYFILPTIQCNMLNTYSSFFSEHIIHNGFMYCGFDTLSLLHEYSSGGGERKIHTKSRNSFFFFCSERAQTKKRDDKIILELCCHMRCGWYGKHLYQRVNICSLSHKSKLNSYVPKRQHSLDFLVGVPPVHVLFMGLHCGSWYSQLLRRCGRHPRTVHRGWTKDNHQLPRIPYVRRYIK